MRIEFSVSKRYRVQSHFVLAVLTAVLSVGALSASAGVESECVTATNVAIVLESNAGTAEIAAAELLQSRLQFYSRLEVTVGREPSTETDLQIYLGQVGQSERLDDLCDAYDLELPGVREPAPEGYAVKSVDIENSPAILAVGADARGVLFAVGEILRQMDPMPLAVRFGTIDVSTAPAYRFRGGGASQGGTMVKITKARPWTFDDLKHAMMDNALAGSNCFYTGWGGGQSHDFVKSFGLMSVTGVRPNEMRGEFPEEWSAGGLDDWEGTHWACPSVPAARKAMLDTWKKRFETLEEDHDVLRMFAGDPGGCRDKRCQPWGKTFVLLCEEIANILLKTHPNINIQIANQDLSNVGDLAIFDYLAEKPRTWLYGLSYGPGSNALSDYFRDELREDLFVYPGHGPVNRYLTETLNHIPKDKKIVHYSDITHWISAQYELENPEPNIMKAYGRRTLHTRPRVFYRVFQAIMPFSEGDIIYTEGYHDHFHQFLWYRLLWNPNRELEDVVQEYCRLYFGREAAEPMAQALYQLEKNIELPLESNDGIGRYYALVKEAGRRMPAHWMEKNHHWRLHMQKAALDKYNQLKLQHELFQEQRIRKALQPDRAADGLDMAIARALAILQEPVETPQMAKYRVEALRLGDESERIFGVRNVGAPKIAEPLRNLPGLKTVLEEARDSTSNEKKSELLLSAIGITEAPTDYGVIWW